MAEWDKITSSKRNVILVQIQSLVVFFPGSRLRQEKKPPTPSNT